MSMNEMPKTHSLVNQIHEAESLGQYDTADSLTAQLRQQLMVLIRQIESNEIGAVEFMERIKMIDEPMNLPKVTEVESPRIAPTYEYHVRSFYSEPLGSFSDSAMVIAFLNGLLRDDNEKWWFDDWADAVTNLKDGECLRLWTTHGQGVWIERCESVYPSKYFD